MAPDRRDTAWVPLLAAEDLESLAGAFLEVVADLSGGAEAYLRLRCLEPSTVFAWGGSAEGLREIPLGGGDTEDLPSRAEGASDPECPWLCVDIPSANGPRGMLLVRSSEPSPETRERIEAMAAFLGIRVAELCTRREMDVELRRNARWFETMDGQIRVLERERQKLAALLGKSEAGALVMGPDYHIRWVNPAVTRHFGGGDNPVFLRGGHCNRLCGSSGVCPDCPTKIVLQTGEACHQERTRTLRGVTRHYYISAFPVKNPKAEIEEILVTLQDLTDLETLRRSEARYQMLFERSADAILLASMDTLEIVMANPRARTLMGIRPNAENPAGLLDIHPEAARADMEAYYRSLVRRTVPGTIETEVRRADGTTAICNANGSLFDLDGELKLLIEYRDVTQIRTLQEELGRANHLITLGTMNAGIAHEFKNRLAPLRAFAQLLTLDEDHTERIRTFAPRIVQEVDRLAVLVRDVLDYARPQEPDPRETDLAHLVDELAEELRLEHRELLQAGGILEAVRLADSAPLPVRLDPEQFRRVFVNILKNALESCEDRTPEIRLEAERLGDRAVLRVHDNGTGIEEKALARIFDPFFTTKGTQGTGLGMCIVRSLIEANGGAIQVGSTPGQGTTVELSFPLAGAEPDAREAA